MQITVIRIETTPEELAKSPELREIVQPSRHSAPNADVAKSPSPVTELAELIPGVKPEGQNIVAERLAINPHGDLLRLFLAENMAWTGATVIGKNHLGEAMDYSDYLRLRRVPSRVGGYAYAVPATGVVEFRLTYGSDEELHKIAPHAHRLTRNHRANVHRVKIRIVDEETLDEAIRLARLAYDATF